MRQSMQPIRRRSAFTLTELLIIITIIVVLMALTIGALFKALVSTRVNNTERTLTKVHDKLVRHMSRLQDEAKKLELSELALQLADDGGTSDPAKVRERARTIQFKLLHKYYFPRSYKEAYDNWQQSAQLKSAQTGQSLYPNGHPIATAIWKRLYGNMTSKPAGAPPVAVGQAAYRECAACLLVAFEQGGGRLDDLTSEEQRDTDADGVPELTDSWGVPVIFFRNSMAPTFYSTRAALAYPGKAGDIDDPQGRLTAAWAAAKNPYFSDATNLSLFQNLFGHAPTSDYLPLVLVSAGPNGDPRTANYGFEDDDDLDTYKLRLSITPQ